MAGNSKSHFNQHGRVLIFLSPFFCWCAFVFCYLSVCLSIGLSVWKKCLDVWVWVWVTYRNSPMSRSTGTGSSAMFRWGHWRKNVLKQWRPWIIPKKPLLAQWWSTLSHWWNHRVQLCSGLHCVFIQVEWTMQWVPDFPFNNSLSINSPSPHQHRKKKLPPSINFPLGSKSTLYVSRSLTTN